MSDIRYFRTVIPFCLTGVYNILFCVEKVLSLLSFVYVASENSWIYTVLIIQKRKFECSRNINQSKISLWLGISRDILCSGHWAFNVWIIRCSRTSKGFRRREFVTYRWQKMNHGLGVCHLVPFGAFLLTPQSVKDITKIVETSLYFRT